MRFSGNTFSFILIILLSSWRVAFCQTTQYFTINTDIEVTKHNILLNNAWAGGLNFAQLEHFDFNNDGIDDILVFDRSGNRILPFVFLDNQYIYSPQYSQYFPDVINWIKLIDYNCDGKKDIFTYTPLGIAVWDNTSSDTKIEFEQVLFEYNLSSGTVMKEAIKTDAGGEYDTNLNIIYQDIPAIVDIDNNGSIDILNFGLSSAIPEGSTVELHVNKSKCGLDFVRESLCWGAFAENYTNNSVTLDVCGGNLAKKKNVQMHAGSSLLVHDFNGNGLPDMLLGDITFENATMVYNTGTIEKAFMGYKDDSFPSYSTPVSLEYFPGFSLVDIDNDGKLDLIASPAIKGSESTRSVWRYIDNSDGVNTNFELDSKSFLQGDMIDVGEGANPHLYDVNNDGLLDLLVGNYGYYIKGGSYKSGISFYENKGSKNEAKFEFVTDNFGDFYKYNDWLNIYPAFGDLNNDGFVDVIIGEKEGNIHYFEGNESGEFTEVKLQYLGIDVGNVAMPNLIDVDDDGLLDLLIGNKKGVVHFYHNTGSNEEANFILISKKWGNIDLSGIDVQGARLSCDIIEDSEKNKTLLLSTQTGVTYAYTNISINSNSSFDLLSSNYFETSEGERATICVGDINNNGYCDVIIGNYSGGLRFFENTTLIKTHEDKLIVYPNPTNGSGYIELKYKSNLDVRKLELFDFSGRKITVEVVNEKINISNLRSGAYILKEQTESGETSTVFIVN